MTWPATDVTTIHVDSPSDAGDPAAFRTDVLDLITKFNQLRNHIPSFMQALISRTTAALSRADLGVAPRATRIDVASVAGTVDLTANAPDTDDIRLTGALAVTDVIGVSGRVVRCVAAGAMSMVNGAGMVTNTGANIQCAAGDSWVWRFTSSNVVEVLSYVSDATTSIKGRVQIATSAEALTGTDSAKAITPATLQAGKMVVGTAVATTSGTSVTFTGIPAWANRVTVLCNSLSTTGTSDLLLRLGTAGGLETSGYVGTVITLVAGTPAVGSFTNGFGLTHPAGTTPAGVHTHKLVLTRIGGNAWLCSMLGSRADTVGYVGSGSKTLAGALDRVSLTTAGGTDTFDLGTMNILCE